MLACLILITDRQLHSYNEQSNSLYYHLVSIREQNPVKQTFQDPHVEMDQVGVALLLVDLVLQSMGVEVVQFYFCY